MFQEREVQYGNLASAIRMFEESDWYLETVDPKPDYYAAMHVLLADCRQALQQAFEEAGFRAEKAIRLQDWENAARELRILCERIPDRSDPRHAESRRKLLDVEKRLEKRR